MCQSHSVSWSRIPVFQLLSKPEEILRKENVSPQPPGSSAQRPSMLGPFCSAPPCVFEETTSDRERWIGRVVFLSFLSPDKLWTSLCETTWYCLEGDSPSHTPVWQQSYLRDDREREWEIRELTPSSEEPERVHFILLPSVSRALSE